MRSGSCRDYETSTPCPGSARRPLALVSWSFPQRSSAVHPGFSRGGPSHPPANHSNGSDEAPWARDDGRSGARRPGSTRSAPSLTVRPVILPLKTHLTTLSINAPEPMVAHGNPTGVARQITNDGPRITQSWATKDDPLPTSQAQTPFPSSLEGFERLRPRNPGIPIQLLDLAQHHGPKDLRHRPHCKKIVRPGHLPPPSR